MPPYFLTSFLKKATFPNSRNEDVARREFILNILLLSALALLLAAAVIDVATMLIGGSAAPQEDAVPSAVIDGLLLFFLFLYFLSRRQFVMLASYFLLGAFFALTAYMGYQWGVDVPAQIVFYPLIIVMAGILISTRVAFFTALLTALTMVTTGYLQQAGMIDVNQYWKHELWTWSDITMIVLIYLIVATVSWLSNREIEKSLKRARRSEAELKQERDTLEVRVEERTRELRQAEMEKMSQAYHFVEFGRLAGGIFHDLVNPLAALSLNIDRIADAPGTRTALSEDVTRAKRAAAHMQKLMDSMRRHLSHEKSEEFFSVRDLLENSVHMLSSYARTRSVRLSLGPSPDAAMLYGDPTAFTQVVTNLISNAVQSYPPPETAKHENTREVAILLEKNASGIRVIVRDYGSGIPEENFANIFEPFFTTKSASMGIGIGLSLAKRVVEKDFNGTLSVESSIGTGSAFTVYLPIREP